jgi:hypothetical protein
MAEKGARRSWVMVNRAQASTLWATVVAEVLGFENDETLTLGRAVAGLNAYSKGGFPGALPADPQGVKRAAQEDAQRSNGDRWPITPGCPSQT